MGFMTSSPLTPSSWKSKTGPWCLELKHSRTTVVRVLFLAPSLAIKGADGYLWNGQITSFCDFDCSSDLYARNYIGA